MLNGFAQYLSYCQSLGYLGKPSSFVPFLILESFPLSCRPVDENISNLCSYIHLCHPSKYLFSDYVSFPKGKQLVCEADDCQLHFFPYCFRSHSLFFFQFISFHISSPYNVMHCTMTWNIFFLILVAILLFHWILCDAFVGGFLIEFLFWVYLSDILRSVIIDPKCLKKSHF